MVKKPWKVIWHPTPHTRRVNSFATQKAALKFTSKLKKKGHVRWGTYVDLDIVRKQTKKRNKRGVF